MPNEQTVPWGYPAPCRGRGRRPRSDDRSGLQGEGPENRPFALLSLSEQKAVGLPLSRCCPVRSRRRLLAVPLLLRVASLAWLSRCSRREALAERVARRTPPLPGSPWDVLPDDIGKMIRDDFPHLWRARQEEFGRGGRSGTAPAIPRSQFVANESAAAAARGKAAREREKTKKAEERAEKISKDFRDSQLALFNSQEETAAANERIAGLEDQLRRERRESERAAHLKRSEELGRRSVEARAREAEARARAADRNKSEAERCVEINQ